MNNVIQIPSKAPSYYSVRRERGGWVVQLITPCPGKALRTSIAWLDDQDSALAYGQQIANKMLRPFKVRGALT